jgi:putative Mg2+ transporter-C (MgtC) family protein
MQELMSRIFPQQHMALLSMFVARLLVASLLGAAIGFERETKHKPAGLRTNMFICFGAAMYTLLSDELAVEHLGDHTRIAAQIIPGIGFIGAGSIMRSGMTVSGLTTAATMFVVASIGMAVGGGLYLPAIFATMLILVSLEFLGWFEQRLNLKPALMKYEAYGNVADEMIGDIKRLLEPDHRLMEIVDIEPSNGGSRLLFGLASTRAEHKSFLEKLSALKSIKTVRFVGTRDRERSSD